MTPHGSAASLPAFQLEGYEGPLDLLFDEVRRQNVAIENLAMAPIVARFLDCVRTAAQCNLDLDIEWLHMAATLIHWKSRALLPQGANAQPEADSIRDDLVQQLLAHRKQAAEELGRRRAVEGTRLSRAAAPGEFRDETKREERGEAPFLSVWDLMEQARQLARWVEQHRQDRRQWRDAFGIEQEDVTVAEMIDYLRSRLATGDGNLNCLSLLQDQPTASRQSCLFLGLLEMVRAQEAEIEQGNSFGPIWVSRCVRG